MTKRVTAACVMMLIDEGKAELDAPVHRWLPELANRRSLRRIDGSLDDTVPAKRDITITPEQKSASAKNFFPNFFDKQSWGYGLSIYTAPDAVSSVPGRYGWIGGFGTSFIVDPNRNLINVVMTQSTDFLFNGALDRFSSELYTATSV